MGALMDATACRVSCPREDAASGEWRDGEERGRPMLVFAPAPETFKLIASSSPPATSSSTVVVCLCPRRLLHFRSAVTISHRPLYSSSAFGPAPFAASSPFPIGSPHCPRQSSPASIPALPLSSSLSLSLHPSASPVSLPSQRLPHSRSDLPIILSSPRQSSPASVPALSLPSSPFLTTVLDSDAIFSIPDRHHHFPHYTLPSFVSVPALFHLSSPTPTKAILAVVMLVLLP